MIVAAQLPPTAIDPLRSRLVLGAWARPWPGEVTVSSEETGAVIARLGRAATLGLLNQELPEGGEGWDDSSTLMLTLAGGHLASASDVSVLGGANRLAVEHDNGIWEVVGFGTAELVAPATYELTHLRRGLEGTEFVPGPASAGRRVLVLNAAVMAVPLDDEGIGSVLGLRIFGAGQDLAGRLLEIDLLPDPVLPRAPTMLAASRAGSGTPIEFTWRRRGRGDGASAGPLEHHPELYQLTVLGTGAPLRTVKVAGPAWTYPAADQVTDFGVEPGSFNFEVRQVSADWGPGHAGEGEFDE